MLFQKKEEFTSIKESMNVTNMKCGKCEILSSKLLN